MHIRLLAVGDRQPSWVDTAFDTYVARLPRQWQFRVEVIPMAARQKKSVSAAAKIASDHAADLRQLAVRLAELKIDRPNLIEEVTHAVP